MAKILCNRYNGQYNATWITYQRELILGIRTLAIFNEGMIV